MDDDHLVGRGNKDFPAVTYSIDFVSDGRNGGVEIELPAVIGGLFVPGKCELDFSNGLIGRLGIRRALELVIKSLRLAKFARKHQRLDLVPSLLAHLRRGLIRPAGPEGVFIEPDALLAVPPKTIAPSRPLPSGNAPPHCVAGCWYQRRSGCAESAAALAHRMPRNKIAGEYEFQHDAAVAYSPM
jgi:hypothetical protein